MAKVVIFNATPSKITVKGTDKPMWGPTDWEFDVEPWGSNNHDNLAANLTFSVGKSGDINIAYEQSWIYVYSDSGLSHPYDLFSVDPDNITKEKKYEYENEFIFFVGSDIEYGKAGVHHDNKMKNKDYMLNDIDSNKRTKAVLLCGDNIYENITNQTAIDDLKNDYVAKFNAKGVPVLIALGNHDVYGFIQAQNSYLDYTRDTLRNGDKNTTMWAGVGYVNQDNDSAPAGGFYCTFNIKQTLFFSCGIYPNSKSTLGLSSIANWIKDDIKYVPAIRTQIPVFIYFHYNIFGDYSDWWSDEEKDKFYDIVRKLNVKGIFCGHLHESGAFKWKDKKIPVYQVGGSKFAKVTVTPYRDVSDSTCSVELINPSKNN